MKPGLHRLRGLVRWGLPVAILAVIAQRIDLGRLGGLAAGLAPGALAWGAGASVAIVMLGALRWHWLRGSTGPRDGYRASLGLYWRALAAGLVLPGSIGMDAYRVLDAVDRPAGSLGAAQAVLAEKLAALAACALIVGALLPLLGAEHLPVGRSVLAAALAGLAAVVLGLLALLRWPPVQAAWRRAGRALAARAGRQQAAEPGAIAAPTSFGTGRWAGALGVSAAIFAVSAWQSHLFFAAMDWPVPYLVNLLAAPLLFLVFALPLTIGTLGVREAAFIAIYGAFDVPAECALLASFCGLAAFLGSCSIGALLLHRQRPRSAGPAGKASAA